MGNSRRARRENLCRTCRHACIVRGAAESQEVVFCDANFDTRWRVPWPVSECTQYEDGRIPAKHDLQDIAWKIVPKRTVRPGFVGEDEVEIVSPKRYEELEKEGKA